MTGLSSALLFAGLLLTAPSEASTPESPVQSVGTLTADALDESSGLAASTRQSGVFWTHNDSGSGPVLFAVSDTGEALGAVRVTGGSSRDWESVASHDGSLYIGDIGNNANRRRDLAVHLVPEPAVDAETVAVQTTVRFRYPDQTAFPPAARNFDAEGLFHDGAHLYLLSKHRGDHQTTLYRFPAEAFATSREVVLTKLGLLDVGGEGSPFPGMVTGADLRGDGERLAVLTYHALLIFDRPEATGHWLSTLRRTVPFDPAQTVQCEAVAWDGDDVVFTNEGRRVFRIRAPGR